MRALERINPFVQYPFLYQFLQDSDYFKLYDAVKKRPELKLTFEDLGYGDEEPVDYSVFFTKESQEDIYKVRLVNTVTSEVQLGKVLLYIKVNNLSISEFTIAGLPAVNRLYSYMFTGFSADTLCVSSSSVRFINPYAFYQAQVTTFHWQRQSTSLEVVEDAFSGMRVERISFTSNQPLDNDDQRVFVSFKPFAFRYFSVTRELDFSINHLDLSNNCFFGCIVKGNVKISGLTVGLLDASVFEGLYASNVMTDVPVHDTTSDERVLLCEEVRTIAQNVSPLIMQQISIRDFGSFPGFRSVFGSHMERYSHQFVSNSLRQFISGVLMSARRVFISGCIERLPPEMWMLIFAFRFNVRLKHSSQSDLFSRCLSASLFSQGVQKVGDLVAFSQWIDACHTLPR